MIKEVSDGPISAEAVDLIEVGIGESGVLKDGAVDYKRLDEFASLNNKFSIHGPYTNDYCGNAVNLGLKSHRNFEIMEKVFTLADYLEAKHIVMHGDRVQTDYREAFLNVIDNLKHLSKIAADHSLMLLIENLHKERKYDRVGVLPHELLQVIQSVNEENLKFCFDIGHGNLSANQYGFELADYVKMLSPYLVHMHVHDNMGIPEVVDERFGDQHLALGKGQVNYPRIFDAVAASKIQNAVLELRPEHGRDGALKSIAAVRVLQAKRDMLIGS